MLFQLLIYAGADPFSYEMTLNKQVCRVECDSLNLYAADYINSFKGKNMSCLHIIILKLDPMNDVTEVIRNEFYKHPLKKRVEINKKEGSPEKIKKKTVNDILQELHAQEAALAAAQTQPAQPQPGVVPQNIPGGIWATVNMNNPNW